MGNYLRCMAHQAKRTKDEKSVKKFMKPKVDRIVVSSSEKKNTVPVPEKGEKGAAIRVKIVLTKKEAAQLLSQCNGDEDMMKMLLSELEKMKTLKSIISSANTVNSSSVSIKPHGGDAWKPVLESIPETCCVLMYN